MMHFGFETSAKVIQTVCDAAKEKLHSFVIRYYATNASLSKVIKRDGAELILKI